MSSELQKRVDRLHQELLELNAAAAVALADLATKGETPFDPQKFESRRNRLQDEIKHAESRLLRAEIPELKAALEKAKRDLKTIPLLKQQSKINWRAAKDAFDDASMEHGKLELREYSLTQTILQLQEDLGSKKRQLKSMINEIVSDLKPEPNQNSLIRN